MVCRLLDVVKCGISSDGASTADRVYEIVTRVLGQGKLEAKHMQSFVGFPFQALESIGGMPNRSSFLCCCPLDRAYTGRTGNKADWHLCCGRFKLKKRLGMSDGIHIYNSAGTRCWEARKDLTSGPDSDTDNDHDNCGRSGSASSASSSCSCSSSDDDNDGQKFEQRVFPELARWTWMCKSFRSRFRRGIGRSLLSEAFEKAGVKSETQVLGPSDTRFFVHSCRFLEQSVRHFSIRFKTLQRAAHLPGNRKDQAAKRQHAKRLWQMQSQITSIAMVVALIPLLREGYIPGCHVVQQSCVPFYAQHIATLRTWCFLICVGWGPVGRMRQKCPQEAQRQRQSQREAARPARPARPGVWSMLSVDSCFTSCLPLQYKQRVCMCISLAGPEASCTVASAVLAVD